MEKENFNAKYIMDIIRVHRNITISEIISETKISRPTVYLHLDTLEKKGLISRKKNFNKKGAPVTISIVENSVKKLDYDQLISFLRMVEKEQELTLTKYKNMNGNNIVYMNATFEGLIDKKIFLTEKGKKFLEDNK